MLLVISPLSVAVITGTMMAALLVRHGLRAAVWPGALVFGTVVAAQAAKMVLIRPS